MTQAKQGDSVRIHYTGRLEDGTVFDRSEPRGPLEFTLGEGRIIPGFEKAVQGMKQGEVKTVTIPPEPTSVTLPPAMARISGVSAVRPPR